jgi:hypothetical protein
MHESTGKQGRFAEFENWMSNVFWYHYKWDFIAGVFAAALLIMSAISFIKAPDYDWTVIYTTSSGSEPSKTTAIRKTFEAACTDVTKNGRVQVEVREASFDGDKGYCGLYGELAEPDSILYVMDEPVFKLFRSLGYFKDAAYISSLGLWAAVNDTPVKPYTLEDFSGYDYTQEELDEANRYRREKHDELVSQARAIIAGMG